MPAAENFRAFNHCGVQEKDEQLTCQPYYGPGCWHISTYENPSEFVFHALCPCGCGDEFAIWIAKGIWPNVPAQHWAWNGQVWLPTLMPSIHRISNCKFHAFMTAGRWDWCPDGAPASPLCVNRGKLL